MSGADRVEGEQESGVLGVADGSGKSAIEAALVAVLAPTPAAIPHVGSQVRAGSRILARPDHRHRHNTRAGQRLVLRAAQPRRPPSRRIPPSHPDDGALAHELVRYHDVVARDKSGESLSPNERAQSLIRARAVIRAARELGLPLPAPMPVHVPQLANSTREGTTHAHPDYGAVTLLILSLALIAILAKIRTSGPQVTVGVLLCASAGISGIAVITGWLGL